MDLKLQLKATMDGRKALSSTWGVFVWAVVWVSLLMWWIAAVWQVAPGIAAVAARERDGLGLIGMLGALGGYVRWMHAFGKALDGQGMDRGKDFGSFWFFQSLLVPLKGAALAIPATLVLRAGLTTTATLGDQSAVNWIGLYAVAGLVGLFSSEAVEKLESAFASLVGSKKVP